VELNPKRLEDAHGGSVSETDTVGEEAQDWSKAEDDGHAAERVNGYPRRRRALDPAHLGP
jgi:hypothetical protein